MLFDFPLCDKARRALQGTKHTGGVLYLRRSRRRWLVLWRHGILLCCHWGAVLRFFGGLTEVDRTNMPPSCPLHIVTSTSALK